MHLNSLNLMKEFLKELPDKELKILDVGSQVVDGQEHFGSYRQFFPNKKWQYIGTDVVEGNNVDVVMEPYKIPFPDEYFDWVISGQTLEHVEFPWELVKEMARVLKVNGTMIVIAPAKIGIHRFPIDAYRFYPDGMVALCKWAGLKPLKSRRSFADQNTVDTYLIATKNDKIHTLLHG